MANINNTNERVFNVSPNIVISVDDNNIADMYIYDEKYRYVLNGYTASDLVCYFADKGEVSLSHEIMDTMMDITIDIGTH